MFETLLSKVAILLSLSMVCGAFGTWLGRNIVSLGGFIVTAVVFILGTVAVWYAAGVSPAVGITVLMGWTVTSGLVMGPFMNMASKEIGWRMVFLAFAGTSAIMAVTGCIGMFSGYDFSTLGMVLTIALFGMIIVGVVRIFREMSREFNIVFALIGVVVFSGFFLVDFARLSKGANTWESAIHLTTSIYLDFINILIRIVELMIIFKKR